MDPDFHRRRYADNVFARLSLTTKLDVLFTRVAISENRSGIPGSQQR
jgi:hypothetical protein